MTGFIYAISDGQGRVKIGWSGDPVRRLAKIKSDCSFPVALLGVIEASLQRESDLHKIFAKHRLHGEWFDLAAPDIAEFVRSLPKSVPDSIDDFDETNKHPLAIYRHRQGVTLKKLADLAGITHASLSRIENGKQFPRVQTIKRLAAITGISAGDIVSFEAAE